MTVSIGKWEFLSVCSLVLLACEQEHPENRDDNDTKNSLSGENLSVHVDSDPENLTPDDLWIADRDLIFSVPLNDEAASDLREVWASLEWDDHHGLSQEQHEYSRRILGKYLASGERYERIVLGWAVYMRANTPPGVGVRRGGGATMIEENATIGVARHVIALGMFRFADDFLERTEKCTYDRTTEHCRKELKLRLGR